MVLDVLTRFRSSDVEKTVKGLSSDQVDVLMKYIYRGFAEPTENSCGILLVWHEKASYYPVLRTGHMDPTAKLATST